MRSSLLAVGVILLVLGAIGYFVSPASATTSSSVQTPTYQGLDVASGGNAYNMVPSSYGSYNTNNTCTNYDSNGNCISNTGFTGTNVNSMYNRNTASTNTAFTNTANGNTVTYNTGFNSMYNNTNSTMNTGLVNTGLANSVQYQNGVEVICITLGTDGQISPTGSCSDTTLMTAFDLGSATTLTNTGYTNSNTNSNTGTTYNTGMNTGSTYNSNYSGSSYSNTGSSAGSGTYNTGTSNTGTSGTCTSYDANGNCVTSSGSTLAAAIGSYASDLQAYNTGVMDNSSAGNTNAASNSSTTTATTTSNGGVGGTTTTTAVTGGSALRTLSIWAMVIGAVLIILGLVIPDAARVETRSRTTSAAGRRVEREEEHRK